MDERSIQRLERAATTVRRVIKTANRMVTEGGGDLSVNQQRIVDGEIELAAIEQEIAALRAGDVEGARDAATTMPPLGHEFDPGAEGRGRPD